MRRRSAERLIGRRGPIYPYDVMSGDDTKKSDEDDAAFVPKSVVVDGQFRLGQR